MDGSLNQPSSVQDDGPMGCKLLLYGQISAGELRSKNAVRLIEKSVKNGKRKTI